MKKAINSKIKFDNDLIEHSLNYTIYMNNYNLRVSK